MKMRPEAFFHAPNRVRILGIDRDSSEFEIIYQWLSERSEVEAIEHLENTGTLQIRISRGDRPGRFIRALKERLHLLVEAYPAEPFKVKTVHALDGRARFQVLGVSGRQLSALASLAAAKTGVKKAIHHVGSDTVLVEYDSSTISQDSLQDMLHKIAEHETGEEHPTPEEIRWGGAIAGTTVLAMCLSRMFPMPVMAIGITLVALRPIRRSADVLIHEGKLNIDSLDVAATFAALATGRPATAAFVIWMVGVGDLLLDLSAQSARHALAKLIQEKEQEAWRVFDSGAVEKVKLEELEVGHRFLVQSGQAIAADGRIIEGFAEIDEKALTGESRFVRKELGSSVLASTFVVQGRIVVEVEVPARDTEAAKIERVLSTIGNKPLTLQRDALEFGGKLVPPTFAIAGAAAVLAPTVTPGVSVLVTDFGTGIRIAVPTAAMTAMTLAAREEILVKGAQYLERLSKTDVIIFDKTGTLTSGLPEVVEVVTGDGYDEDFLIELAASAEIDQEHPVARALRSYAEKKNVKLGGPERGSEQYFVGRGLSAQVNGHRVRLGRASWLEEQGLELHGFKEDLARLKKDHISTLCIAVGEEVAGVIGYSDVIRPESAAILSALQANGRRKVILLSGDSDEVVKKVALEVGITEAVGSLLPGQKADYVRKLKEQGHIVTMIGDGINDAPALALADVGVSIAGSAEVALETADVILLEGGLRRLPIAFKIADGAMAGVKRSLGFIIAPNAAAIALGAFGYISPSMAAVINNGATFVAVAASTFPLLWRRPRLWRSESKAEFSEQTESTLQNSISEVLQSSFQRGVRRRRLLLVPRIAGFRPGLRMRLLRAFRLDDTMGREDDIHVNAG